MVRRRERQRRLWEVVLPDASKLWPADLRRIDTGPPAAFPLAVRTPHGNRSRRIWRKEHQLWSPGDLPAAPVG
jgi:hypothetical protein